MCLVDHLLIRSRFIQGQCIGVLKIFVEVLFNLPKSKANFTKAMHNDFLNQNICKNSCKNMFKSDDLAHNPSKRIIFVIEISCKTM